jgi:hypothetical protein
MSQSQRSLRLLPKDINELNRATGNKGEVFFDSASNTLRVFNGSSQGGFPLMRADLSNIAGGASNIDFGARTLQAAGFIGQISDISNHLFGELSNIDVAGATDGQLLYYNAPTQTWKALSLNSTFNGGEIANALRIRSTTSSTDVTTGALIVDGGLGVAASAHIGTSLTVGAGLTVTTNGASITGNSTVTGSLTATTGLTVNTGPIAIRGNNRLRLYDTDNSNFVALRSPTNLTADVTYQLPGTDGTSGQALITNGLGTLSWATISGGGGGGGVSNPPGGVNGNIQFNNNSNFGGVTTLSYNINTDTFSATNITISGSLDGDATGTITNINGIQFVTGVSITEFSSDSTLTDDSDSKVSTQAAVKAYVDTGLESKAPIDSPTFTGTVSGIDSTMVGLGNVEDTAISTWPGSTSITTIGILPSIEITDTATIGGDVTVSGNVNISTLPTQSYHATNKKYVDSKAIAMSIALS